MTRARSASTVAPVLVALLLAASCTWPGPGPAAPSTFPSAPPPRPPGPPDAGPLHVSVSVPATESGLERAGAAGRVVRCLTEVTGGSADVPFDGEVVARTPTSRLASALSYAGAVDDAAGLREVRREGARVLLTDEAGGRPVMAVILAHGKARDGRVGWYVDSWRSATSQSSPTRSRRGGAQMWTDPAGRRLPTTLISSSTGPEHCDWEDITFLHLSTRARREATQVYVRNPPRPQRLRHRALPGGATVAGRRGRHGLPSWRPAPVALGRRTTRLGRVGYRAETWPRPTQPLGCI